MSIAYATLNYILEHVGCRTLFATHYHELGKLLLTKDVPTQNDHTGIWLPPDGAVRRGVSFWCTDVDEMDGSFAYSYRLRPGINCNSHAIVSRCKTLTDDRKRRSWQECRKAS